MSKSMNGVLLKLLVDKEYRITGTRMSDRIERVLNRIMDVSVQDLNDEDIMCTLTALFIELLVTKNKDTIQDIMEFYDVLKSEYIFNGNFDLGNAFNIFIVDEPFIVNLVMQRVPKSIMNDSEFLDDYIKYMDKCLFYNYNLIEMVEVLTEHIPRLGLKYAYASSEITSEDRKKLIDLAMKYFRFTEETHS